MYEQLNLFNNTMETFKINKKIRLIELFAGIGSQAMALRDLGADFEHYRAVEFDKFAVRSYNAIHNTNFKLTDITQISGSDLGIVEPNIYCYIMTYSFPCQDLSLAGKQKGMTKGSGTRSGLLWKVERLLSEVQYLPQVLLMENVPQVHSKKNMPDFQKWIDFLEGKGYSNYWQDLNAKNYGVAQNRNRCFMVSLLGKWGFTFPEPISLDKTMKDYLEDEVEEKYYINTKKAQKLIQQLIVSRKLDGCLGNINPSGNGINSNVYAGKVAPTLTTNKGEGAKIIVAMRGRNPDNPSDRTAGSPIEQRLEPNSQGICNTLTSVQKDNMVLERLVDLYNSKIRDDELCGTITSNGNTSSTHCGTFGVIERASFCIGGLQKHQTPRTDGISPSITAACGMGGGHTPLIPEYKHRVRKLIPLECWRLMGFSDDDFCKAAAVNSNTQLYKQAGNSIVLNVLIAILGQMIPAKESF